MFVQEIQVSLKRKYTSSDHLKTVVQSIDAIQYVRAAFYNNCEDHNEHMAAIYMNRANKIIGFKVLSSGGMTGTVCDVRTVLAVGLQLMAVGIILVHNHPSGNLKPSKADEMLTKKVKEGAQLMDMNVLDHLIITPFENDGYYSFADEGLL